MKKPKDDRSEDKAARRLQQFQEARERVEGECEDEKESIDKSIEEESESKVGTPKPVKSDEKPQRKKRESE